MFVSSKFAFLELHKTGCTHIRNILSELLDGELVGKHNQAGPELFSRGRVFLGSIRDPWEWYISLWAYGCDGKGVIFDRVTKNSRTLRGLGWRSNPYGALVKLLRPGTVEKWRRTYTNVDDAEAFREWLKMMHDPDYVEDIGEGYSKSSLYRACGLMTFRYLTLFCTRSGELEALRKLATFEQVVDYEQRNCFIDHFIRNENLESDLLSGLEKFGEQIPDETRSSILSRARTNTSSRTRGPQYYYDTESEQLVGERERLIIDKFGYELPSKREAALNTLDAGGDSASIRSHQ